jgi:hypothetical protein
MTTEISPRIVDGEPTCSGRECPRCYGAFDFQLWCGSVGGLNSVPIITDQNLVPSMSCLPALRRQRDDARRELCEADAGVGMGEGVGLDHYTAGLVGNDGLAGRDFRIRVMEYATSRGWSYLYAK